MSAWIPYAMVRVSFFFIAGILLGIFWPQLILADRAAFIAVLMSAVYVLLWFFRSRWLKEVRGLLGLSAVLVIGFLNVHRSTDASHETHLLHVTGRVHIFRAVIARYGEEKEKSWRYEADVTDVKTDSGWQSVTGRILLYVSKTDSTVALPYGSVIVAEASPQIISASPNPGEFDMQTYQRYRKIYHRCFVRQSSFRIAGHEPPSRFLELAIAARSWATARLKATITTPREQATMTALVLGVTDSLDDELLAAYSATGAMHVLAVSGLHVSIIYWIILLIFKPLDKYKSGKWVLAAGSIVLLWSYAFITGWSPSVLRAVTMFTFVALSRPWKQSTMIYNTLAASAFCLLLYDPYFIMSVGFQLSYLAVLGIVWLQRPLYTLWEPRSKFVDECWKVISVSIAAQITTLPLTLYCFHQFPVYFLIANLIVIPVSFVVLVGGLALLPISLIPVVSEYFGIAMGWTVRVMNEGILITESLPYSKIENIFMDAPQAFILCFIIISFCLAVLRKSFPLVVCAAGAVAVFALLQWQRYAMVSQKNELVVYDVRGHSAIDWIHAGETRPIGDSLLFLQPGSIAFHQTPYRLIAGGTHILRNSVPNRRVDGLHLYMLNGYSVVKINGKVPLPRGVVNCVILSNNSTRQLETVVSQLKSDLIVIDSSNSYYIAEELKRQAQELGVAIWSVPHSGALVYTIRQ